MQGYSPKWPLTYDKSEDGIYMLNKTLLETIKQNLKFLLLTNPRERIMDPDFGVGITRFLFEQDTTQIRQILSGRITSQIAKYMNYINVEEINLSPVDSNQENMLFIEIKYSIPSLNATDSLSIKPF